MKPFLHCHGVSHRVKSGNTDRTILSEVCLALDRGTTGVLLGPSGSGKTTMLSILGGILAPVSGRVELNGQSLDYSNRQLLPRWRRCHVGFVFQQSRLLPFLSVEENLRLIGLNAGVAASEISSRIGHALKSLDIEDKRGAMPGTLSGGESQRVAIARAILHRPALLLADEPTAALDGATGTMVVDLLVSLTKQTGAVLLVVTHDVRMVPKFDKVLHLDNGKVVES